MKGIQNRSSYTDHELVDLIKKGDQQGQNALADLYVRYRDRMIREAYYILKDLNESEDIVQEIFILIWNSKAQNISVEKSFLPYLLKSTWNKSISALRVKNKMDEHEQMYSYISEKIATNQPFEREELAKLLDKALELVPPAARRSFMLQYMEGQNQKSVAVQQNVSLQVVKNNVSLALRILRKALGQKKSL